jgi:hypothetical protein
VDLLLPVISDRNNADLEGHAATSWSESASSLRSISRQSQRRGEIPHTPIRAQARREVSLDCFETTKIRGLGRLM